MFHSIAYLLLLIGLVAVNASPITSESSPHTSREDSGSLLLGYELSGPTKTYSDVVKGLKGRNQKMLPFKALENSASTPFTELHANPPDDKMAEEFRTYMNEEVRYVIITTITKVEEFKKHQLLYIPNAKIPLLARSSFTTTSFHNYAMNNPTSVWKGLASDTAVITKDTGFGNTMYVPPNIQSAGNPFGINRVLMRYDAFKAEKNHPVADWKQLNIYNLPNDF